MPHGLASCNTIAYMGEVGEVSVHRELEATNVVRCKVLCVRWGRAVCLILAPVLLPLVGTQPLTAWGILVPDSTARQRCLSGC